MLDVLPDIVHGNGEDSRIIGFLQNFHECPENEVTTVH